MCRSVIDRKILDVCNGFLFYAQMNAWAVATILGIPTAVVALLVSYATERPSESQLRNLTWYSLRALATSTRRTSACHTALLLMLILTVTTIKP